MKISHFFFLLVAVLLVSCGQQNENSQTAEYDGYVNQGESNVDGNNQQNANYQNRNPKSSNYRGIKYFNQMDPQFGIPFGAMPIPVSWKESTNTKENLLFEGPNGIKIYKAQTFTHFYSNDPELNQIYMQSGSSVQPVKSIERFINEDLKSIAQSQGIHFVRQYPLPQIAQFDTRLDGYLFKGTPEQKQFQCILTEWKDRQGNPSMVIVRYFVTQYQIGGLDWGYTLIVMDANKENYEETKNACINSIVNFQINPHWIQTSNRYWSQMAQQRNTGHQQRMEAIASFGRNNTAAFNARSAAFDAQNKGWMADQEFSYGSQLNYIDGIWERTNVRDPNSGQNHKVESGNDYYFSNGNGKYIGTNNSLYDPNLDNNINNQNWTQLEKIDDR